MTTSAIERRRGRLVEYVPWMARDYFTNQGPSTAVVVLLIGFLTLAPAVAGGQMKYGDIPLAMATQLLRALTAPLVFIGVLFATNGIVANDRKLGYYRFLFSKPIGPPAYYATTFLVNGIGFLVVCAVLMAFWYFAVRPVFPFGILVAAVIMYVAYGGLGFLLSAAWRFDWLSLVGVLFISNVAWTVWGSATGVRHWVLYLLPPAHRTNEVYGLVLRDASRPIPWEAIAWLAGYGALCFALGLVVVRRRPLGTS